MKASEIHETALRRMVRSRGGLMELGSVVLHIWISWYLLPIISLDLAFPEKADG